MNQVNNLERLLEDRIVLYSEQIQQIKLDPDYNYNILYNIFFLEPLSFHPKKTETSGFSRAIQNTDFSKSILYMISDIEEKLLILQNLIL